MNQTLNEQLLDFIHRSPSMFHAIASIRAELDAAGYMPLLETEAWHIEPDGKYYTVRNGSSLIAFQVGRDTQNCSFRIAAAHSDSPVYKIKAAPELKGPEEMLRLNVEAYGGMIDSTWLDRPLSVAGRVLIRNGDAVETRLFCTDRDVVLIPNLAIHFNRDVNKGYAFNRQTDLCPLFSAGKLKEGDFDAMVAGQLGIDPKNLLAKDLFLANRQRGCVWGAAGEFISSPRLDDLQCAFSALRGFLAGERENGVNVFCCFDNEEVGSNTRQGAMSTFLKDCLKRISGCLGLNSEEYARAVASSFLLSADNAHAVHPNHPEKTDAENRCFLNRGIVIKENAAQKYTTDAVSRAIVREICEMSGEPYQLFANRSDMAGGSTLGNLSNIQVSLHAADVGLPQLAMHSSYETAGAEDTASAVNVFRAYYRADLCIENDDKFVLRPSAGLKGDES